MPFGKDQEVKDDEPEWFMPGSKSEAAVRGFANAATFGLAPKISAGVNGAIDALTSDRKLKDAYGSRLREYLAGDEAARQKNPGMFYGAGAAPMAVQALATGGGSLGRQVATNAAMGGVNAFGNADPDKSTLGQTAAGAGIGAVLPAAFRGIGKVTDKVSNAVASTAIARNLKDAMSRADIPSIEKIFGISNSEYMKESGGKSITDLAQYVITQAEKSKIFGKPIVDELGKKIGYTAAGVGQTSGGQHVKNVLSAIGRGSVGAGLTAGVNYTAGSPVDPSLAFVAGATMGGTGATSDAIRDMGLDLVKRYALREGSQMATGPLTQFATQSMEKNPFGRLSETLFPQKTNTEVQQLKQQVEPIMKSTDEAAKRKTAMELSKTPAGRAVFNNDSPVNEEDYEDSPRFRR